MAGRGRNARILATTTDSRQRNGAFRSRLARILEDQSQRAQFSLWKRNRRRRRRDDYRAAEMKSSPLELLIEGCDHVSTREELEQRLTAGMRLHVKFGIDPTGNELHLGHAVVLHKMQQFIELGHRVTLLIGYYTARIGDPSGRSDARPPMSGDQIDANMKTYREQAGKVLDLERTEVMYNSTWLAPLRTEDWI